MNLTRIWGSDENVFVPRTDLEAGRGILEGKLKLRAQLQGLEVKNPKPAAATCAKFAHTLSLTLIFLPRVRPSSTHSLCLLPSTACVSSQPTCPLAPMGTSSQTFADHPCHWILCVELDRRPLKNSPLPPFFAIFGQISPHRR
ncbi:hypothetical protein TorRG33x02_355790 [Trema orientale]|uniref:Uncharacterized protein n=1 Tax=Trema orientale TaxID=63057 RepID=A0A2P5A8S4_TREOI|nr:hypothetical protein TorRG33x02_355790 [Trema orientale]